MFRNKVFGFELFIFRAGQTRRKTNRQQDQRQRKSRDVLFGYHPDTMPQKMQNRNFRVNPISRPGGSALSRHLSPLAADAHSSVRYGVISAPRGRSWPH